jgi:hypothetical protein
MLLGGSGPAIRTNLVVDLLNGAGDGVALSVWAIEAKDIVPTPYLRASGQSKQSRGLCGISTSV